MAREHHETTSQQQQQQRKWGTLELLLLVCAVNRHGTESWDSIAMEVQNRGSTLSSLTPQDCRDKFNETRRRFMAQNDLEPTSLVPLVDQLRQIRVQELRAEVQRRDVSIVRSLELKVKRLEEERKKSLKSESDLERDRKESPYNAAAVDGDGDSNRSFNESNSTTQKTETTKKKQNDDVDGEEEREPKMKPEQNVENDPVRIKSEPDREDRNWSSNGKINGNVKDKTNEDNDKTASEGKVESVKNKASGVGESNESKREGNQGSDVQSCSSLSKNKRRRGGGEADEEEVSPATKKVLAVKSEPLVRFLGLIRSHRLGSHFERRIRSQESERYKKLVRQHIDLRTIQSRLERGCYYNCFQKFFRDLLLLFNNFIMFFRKSSQEYAAAQELRALLTKEMVDDELRKQKPIDKPNRASSTMVVCGKRSCIRAISSKNANSKKGDNKKESEVEEKPKVDDSFAGMEGKGVKKKTSQERSVSVQRKSTSSNKSSEGKHQYGGNELSSHDASESKKETSVKKKMKKKKKKKKQGAASFLQRMKQNSPSEVSDDESKDSKVVEEKRRRTGRKRDVKRERVEISSRGRGMKRGVGRPPMTTEKKGGDNGESEGGGGGGRNRKRTRRWR